MSDITLNVVVQGNIDLANKVIHRIYDGKFNTLLNLDVIKKELKEILIEVCNYDLIYLGNDIFITNTNPFFDEVMSIASNIKTTNIHLYYNCHVLKVTVYNKEILEEFLCYHAIKNPDKVYESYWDFESEIDVY